MAKPLRILLTVVKWLAGIIAMLVLAVFAINAFDEDLRPETIALLTPGPNPYDPEQNLYFALLGFNAPEDKSIVAVGQARIAENEAMAAEIRKAPQAFEAIFARYRDPTAIRFKGEIDFCSALTRSCWAEAEKHEADIAALRKNNETLYRRYLGLHALPGYFEIETEKPGYIMRFAYVPGEVRALFLSDTALRVKRATSREARNAALLTLRDDVDLWRRVLVGDGGLISKMIAVASLHGDYILLGDLIADPSVDLPPLSGAIEDIVGRVTPDNWKMHNIFAVEFRVSTNWFDQARDNDEPLFKPAAAPDGEQLSWWEPYWGRLQGHFFKVNATQNLGARAMVELQKMADADPQDLVAAQQAFHDWIDRRVAFGPTLAYNPMGKWIVAIGASPYDGYPLRVYDVAAYARAVRLAYELRKQQIRSADIPAFNQQHPEWGTHSVSADPIAWDPEARSLRVPIMGKTPFDRRFDVPVWAAPGTAH